MLVCVDGTGPTDTAVYAREFAHSFVNRIKHGYRRLHPPPSPAPIHHRGPGGDAIGGTFGGVRHVDPSFIFDEVMRIQGRLSDEVERIPSWALNQPMTRWPAEDVAAFQRIQERRKIFMTGYSRGGAIVIHTARLLQLRGLRVEAMFLFDAVSRNPNLDANTIPSNVGRCFHAVRDPRAGSRESFGNCGLQADVPRTLELRFFQTTHGGMGGVPWGDAEENLNILGNISEGFPDFWTETDPEQEATGMAAVETFMWPHLRRFGVVP
jgi:pimeloyl-ACP methyl ester carboxylesterase